MDTTPDIAELGLSREDLGLDPIPAAPETEQERSIVDAFSLVLGIGGLGATDSFFVLGGDSLRAEELLTHFETLFGISLPASTLMDASTPRELAKCLAAGAADGSL